LNCANGTLDLKTGELRRHDRADHISKVIPVEYDSGANCPLWVKFLTRVTGGDSGLVYFLRRVLGYTLTGKTGEKALFFIFGPTDSGKTTFLETIRSLLGDYARATDFNTFLYKKYGGAAIRNDIARLQGARFVSASEAAGGQKFDEPVVKQLTGRDTVVARFLYKEFQEFVPEFKVFLGANHKPQMTEIDDAIWNRIVVIPFNTSIPKSEQDKGLRDRLKNELPGILAWAVTGCIEWQEEGLQTPHDVLNALKAYRHEADVVEHFISDKCRRWRAAYSTFGELYDAWDSWRTGKRYQSLTEKGFAQALDIKGFAGRRIRIDGEQVRVRNGIVLKSKLKEQIVEKTRASRARRETPEGEDSRKA
jgi:putative DNA primase/helicase